MVVSVCVVWHRHTQSVQLLLVDEKRQSHKVCRTVSTCIPFRSLFVVYVVAFFLYFQFLWLAVCYFLRQKKIASFFFNI